MKIACDECNGTGTTVHLDSGICPWCSGEGLQKVDYVVYGGGHNGDFEWRELYEVCSSVREARISAV